MTKTSLNLDFAKIAGAQIVQSPKTGDTLLVFNLDDGSTRLKKFNRRDGSVGAGCNLDVIPNTKPNEYNEDTHWIGQFTTKDERAAGLKLPSVGSGREWPDRDDQQPQQQRQNPPPQQQARGPQPRQPYQQPSPRPTAQQQPPVRHGYGNAPLPQPPPPADDLPWDADGAPDVPF